jgi:hypothetical protein
VAAGDRFLPDADRAVTELTLVDASPARTYAAIAEADVSGDRLLGAAGGLLDLERRLGGDKVQPRKLGELLGPELGFVPLADEPPTLFAVGFVGRYSPFDRAVVRLQPGEFASYADTGHLKAVLAFSLRPQEGGQTLLTCDARVRATDDDTRSTLSTTAFLVMPAARRLCRRLLELVKQAAESGPQHAQDGDRDRDQHDPGRLPAG